MNGYLSMVISVCGDISGYPCYIVRITPELYLNCVNVLRGVMEGWTYSVTSDEESLALSPTSHPPNSLIWNDLDSFRLVRLTVAAYYKSCSINILVEKK